ncbi:MAG: acyl-CoA dehydrogenase, partial [Myxococcota bacterium]
MSDLDTFRARIRAWIEAHAPRSLWGTAISPFQGYWGGRDGAFESEDQKIWFEAALPEGLTAPTWPREHGGGGLSRAEGRVFSEELSRHRIPLPMAGFGLTMLGPILLEYGTPAQKAAHIPPIVRGEIRWCQGYSEPNAGSDLASLRTAAIRDGDHFVVSGQKIWTSFADMADWIFCLVRTSTEGRKHAGISFLLIDMASPGVSVRPIELISGYSPFCETFFTDVRVPAENLIGEAGGGWRIARSLLGHERDMIGEAIISGGTRPQVLTDYALREHALSVIGTGPDGRLADAHLRERIARSEMDREAGRLTLHRIRGALSAGGKPGPETSIVKVFGTELNQQRWQLATEILGEESLYWDVDAHVTEEMQQLTRTWLRSRGNSIEGGTSEIQLNIIATRVLGLPRPPR